MHGKVYRMVVVDDHPLFRLGLVSLLNRVFSLSHIQEAGDGAFLLHLITSSQERIDLVILDVNLPSTDIAKTIDMARTFIPELKIVALVESYNEAIASRLLQKGFNGIILKSAEVSQVEAVLRTVMQKGYCYGMGTPDIDYRMVFREKRKYGRKYVELTDREIQIIKLIAEEKTTDEIGSLLAISPRTVEGYRKKILVKTSSKNTAGIVIFGIQNHIVEVCPVRIQ